MIIAVAVSKLVDPKDKIMNFGSEEMEKEYVQRMLALVDCRDVVGNIDTMKKPPAPEDIPMAEKVMELPSSNIRAPRKTRPTEHSKIIAIEEVEDEEDGDQDDDEDLVPFQKPDDDPSDSDEDPTLVNRPKPSAPVYIIDLIKQLQKDDQPEMVEMALRVGPDLIRRKANFGTELAENVQVVASSLLNLKEGVQDDDLRDLRLGSLVACTVSKPAIIGPWLASMYFEGDFSLEQRATILTTFGLSARELSGHKGDDEHSDETVFPSKRLPGHLAAIYAPSNAIAREIEHSTLQPLALAAADKLSGPDVLKVRTFSSRLEVQRKKEEKQKERSRRIPKELHRLLTEHFYLPLCCRMSLLLSSNVNFGRSSMFEANVVRLFIQTLTIILHCLGPNAVQLEGVTRETLDLLMSLHNIPMLGYDPVVLPALLQLLLTTLDLNVAAGRSAEERLVTDFGNTLAELISWAGGIEENRVSIPIVEEGEEGMGMPWTVILAGIQVKWHEVGRKFQGRMMGLMGVDLDEG
jgi:telomere length regulation protein